MSANASDPAANKVAAPPVATAVTAKSTAPSAPTEQQSSRSGVPKKIVNAQTVCNEKNEKGKLCNGHLKQLRTGGEEAEEHLRGNDVLFKCQSCGTLYMGPPLGHVRDPDKQQRFVERELAALLQAAGGTLPAFRKSETGAWVPVEDHGHHAPAPAAKPATTAKPSPATAKPAASAPSTASAPTAAKPAAEAGSKMPAGYVPPPAPGPVPGETPEQKLARLKAIVAEAKRRKEAAAAGEDFRTTSGATPAAASTSGTDSSAQADAHRPAAEAQASTGLASAAPLSPAAATASPAAGAETVADLAPDASTEKTPAAPKAGSPSKAASPPIPGASGPVPGETHEQKIARLKAVVAEAKARAEREGKSKSQRG